MVLDTDLPETLFGRFSALWKQGDFQALEALHTARNGVNARSHALLLLTIGRLHLRRGEGELASRWFDEGLGLTRSHRLAREMRHELLIGASVAARVIQDFSRAAHHAEAALRAAQDPSQRATALLAQATVQRLTGDAWGSLMPTHAALELGSKLEGEVTRTLTWMTLAPDDTLEQATVLAQQVTGALRARLAWHLAEQALAVGNPPASEQWLALTATEPFAREELRLCSRVQSQQTLKVPAVRSLQSVRVLTLARQGVQADDRFLPVAGDGRLLALLAFLIEDGTTHWERAAEAVLGEGSRGRLYGQIRHHLSSLRTLLGHPGAVTSRKGVLSLDSTLEWSCDALDPGARSENWLPHLEGWWIQERRAQLRPRA